MKEKFSEWIDNQFSDFYELPRGFRKVVGIEVRRQLPVEDSAIRPKEAKRKIMEISNQKNRDVKTSVGRDPMSAADAIKDRNVSTISNVLTRQNKTNDLEIVTNDFLLLEAQKTQREQEELNAKQVPSASDNYIPASPVCGSFESEASDEDEFCDQMETQSTVECTELTKTVKTSSLNTNFFDNPISNRTFMMSDIKHYLNQQFVDVNEVDDFHELEDDVIDAAVRETGRMYRATTRINVTLSISKRLADTDPRSHKFCFKFKCLDQDASVSD